jgi:rhodanese-related sulfurtransferase
MNNLIQLIREKKATIIDVRSQMEFDQEHFPGALLIPLETIQEQAIKIGQMLNQLLFIAEAATEVA